MHTISHTLTCCLILLACLFAGCTLKLTTDLSKVIGVDNPKELMASSEAQQIATKIGEGMGTKIMEGEILAEDMGKGLGEVFLRPVQVAIITDPVSRDLIEKIALEDVRAGKLPEAITAYKRTNNLARLEEIALILFDRGHVADAADLHQYLIDHAWPIRAPYLVALQVEQQGLAAIRTASLKDIDPQQYNLTYTTRSHTVLETASLSETFVRQHVTTREEMITRLKASPVIILADSYFDSGQHGLFFEIVSALHHRDLVIGLEQALASLKDNRNIAERLNYLPLLTFLEEKHAATFTHGPAAGNDPVTPSGTVDFHHWDSSLAAAASDLAGKKKQVLLIVGSTHASPDHLPFMIAQRSGINPVIVAQGLLNTQAEDWHETHESMRITLASWGAAEGSVISIDNDFHVNTPLSPEDFTQYTELFALTPRAPVH